VSRPQLMHVSLPSITIAFYLCSIDFNWSGHTFVWQQKACSFMFSYLQSVWRGFVRIWSARHSRVRRTQSLMSQRFYLPILHPIAYRKRIKTQKSRVLLKSRVATGVEACQHHQTILTVLVSSSNAHLSPLFDMFWPCVQSCCAPCRVVLFFHR
jgi:hypothetical protein